MDLNGIICFCGEQGSGKTLSAVQYLRRVCKRYPKAKVVSNIEISIPDIDNKLYYYEGLDMMMDFNNGEHGVIFFIDEMHLEFNSLESKGMDIRTFELVSQQRKARKHIIGTSQVFGRLAKPFREQFKYAVLCERYLGYLLNRKYIEQNLFLLRMISELNYVSKVLPGIFLRLICLICMIRLRLLRG